MKWVHINDAKPSTEGPVLVCANCAEPDKPLVTIAWWQPKTGRFEWLPREWSGAVTHWMPLPEPPEQHGG